MPQMSLSHVSRILVARQSIRLSSTKSPSLDISSLLQEPSWSAHSLLTPNITDSPNSQSITLKELQHLSTLSALPVPTDPTASLSALQSHLHFVSTVRSADTTGVQPLQSLRDETVEGEKEAEFGMRELREVLEGEEVVGKFHRRIRRKRTGAEPDGKAEWDVLGMAEKRVGRYFVVDRAVSARNEEENGG